MSGSPPPLLCRLAAHAETCSDAGPGVTGLPEPGHGLADGVVQLGDDAGHVTDGVDVPGCNAAAVGGDEEETGYRAGQVESLVTFQPMVSTVDSEQFAYIGWEPEQIGEPTEINEEVARMEWVPLASVPDLIAAGKIWESGALVALMRVLLDRR